MKKRLLKLMALVMASVFVLAGTVFAASEGKIDLPCTGANNSYADMHQEFLDKLSEYTDGRFTGTMYPGGQMGTEDETFQGTIMGTYKVNCVSTAAHNNFAKASNYFNIPFLFTNVDDVLAKLDELKDAMQADYEAVGVHLLAFNINGFRQLTSNKEINSFDALKGLKIRTMDTPIQIKIWTDLGTNPTPINFSELYLALQQGTVDAEENPLSTIFFVNLFEQQKYVYLTNHMMQFNAFTVNLDFWNELSPEDQEAFEKAATEACATMNEAIAHDDEMYIAAFEEAGVTVSNVTEDFITACREATADVKEEVAGTMDAEVFAALEVICAK